MVGDSFKTTALFLLSSRDTEILVNSLRLLECLAFRERNPAELNALSLRAHEAGLRDHCTSGCSEVWLSVLNLLISLATPKTQKGIQDFVDGLYMHAVREAPHINANLGPVA
jgi:hypothetical protein